MRAIYELYDRVANLDMVQVDAPHNYNKQSREAVYKFFGKQVLGEKVTATKQRDSFGHLVAAFFIGLSMTASGTMPRLAALSTPLPPAASLSSGVPPAAAPGPPPLVTTSEMPTDAR